MYGKEKEYSSYGDYLIGAEQGKSYDIKEILDESSNINTKKLGKYLYFTFVCDDYEYDDNDQIKRSKVPAIYYFKFK